MRILVVEDEPALRDQLKSGLTRKGFAVDATGDGREGLHLGSEYPYDLAIIDLGLPALSGIELITHLRRESVNYPVLILTARGDWQDKVAGLEAGADDYLTKPFHFEELTARVNALLRRAAGHASAELRFGPLSIDTNRKAVHLHGAPLELTGYEYRTLEYLALHAGSTVSKSELTEHLYEQDFDRDSNVIEVFIGRLRRKLDPDGILNPIATLRGQGYRFELRA